MKKPEILVVDDRAENLLAMQRVLNDLDAEIHTASSGNEALAMVLDHDFALILLDVQMPDMDGFETAEMVRLYDKTAHIPIIFVTAISKERKHIFKGYASGAVDYIFKPVDREILLSKVKVFLTLYRQRQELQQLVQNLQHSQELIAKQNATLTLLALHDELTGLYNRRHLNTILAQEFYRSKRYGTDLAILMLDLDHFKNVNDTYGHAFGDFVLKEFAHRMKKISRPTDLIFRFGGEEFLILLPQTDIEGGVKAGEQIRKICATEMYEEGPVSISVTTSIGAAAFHNDKPEEPDQLIEMADKALYQAKDAGRNRVLAYTHLMEDQGQPKGV
ncbi:MAG: diguanylate cyclase [Proteobacteria bacterium]|nr:diguanylate cyclase [Pseudomonadota bacterium]MBU1649656.1 diguanylate cyclase [Pseudomonadota bacterium]